MLLSSALRVSAGNSIKVLTDLFGLPSEIYYPKGYESGRGGYDGEIQFNEEPDWKGKLLVPFVFNNTHVHFGGMYDMFAGDEKAIYLDHKFKIEINSKNVIRMEGGEEAYLVSSIDGNNDDLGKIYQKCLLVPYNKFEDYKVTSDKNKLKVIELNNDEIDLDILTDDFEDKMLFEEKEIQEEKDADERIKELKEETENSEDAENNENNEETESSETNETKKEKNCNLSGFGVSEIELID